MEVVNEDTVLFPGDKAIVVADNQVIDAVRAAFKARSIATKKGACAKRAS